jgi:TolB protein
MKTDNQSYRVWLLSALIVAAVWPQSASAKRHDKLRISVSGADFKPYPVAAPDLVAKGDAQAAPLGRTLTELLRTDVDLARTFELVPPASYLAAKNPSAGPVFDAWQSVGASGLITGDVTVQKNQLNMALQFHDVGTRKTLISKSCTTDVTGGGRCIHQFLDAVIAQLTGEMGVFSSRIAFVRRVGKTKAIYTADMDGGALEKTVASGNLSLLPAWDTLGKTLYFTSYVAGGTHLFRLATPTGRIDSVSAKRGLNVGAAVSPDGKRVALTLTIDGNAEIYAMDTDGKNLVRLTNSLGQDVSPTWSPDGKRIAFVSSRSGSPHIYVMGADGSGAKRLTYRGNYNQEPDWSPRSDGQIAFTARDETLSYDLFLVHPDTGEITRLTQDGADNMSPSYSPDGQHIAFTSNRSKKGRQEMYVMDVDGHNMRSILPGVTDCETPAWSPRLGY